MRTTSASRRYASHSTALSRLCCRMRFLLWRDAKGKEQVIGVRGSDLLQSNERLMVQESLL